MNEKKYISILKQVIVDEYEKDKETGKVATKKVIRDLRFVDSLRFTPSSFDALS